MKTSKRKSRIGSVLVNLVGKTLLVAAAFALVGAATAQAGLTGFVTIGDPNTTDDDTNYGAVDYTYQISATAVTIAEFTASGVGDGDENYWNAVGTDAPATMVSLSEAKMYANYLTEQANGDSTGYNLYNSSGTGAGSYSRSQAITDGRLVYGIPTEDEWYKAAYYKGSDTYSDYANGANVGDATGDPPPKSTDDSTGWNYGFNQHSDTPWTVNKGTQEQNGTYNMMGNVWEWQEVLLGNGEGVVRGGLYFDDAAAMSSSTRYTGNDATRETEYFGLRVVAIPEPASLGLFGIVCGALWFVRRKFRSIAS